MTALALLVTLVLGVLAAPMVTAAQPRGKLPVSVCSIQAPQIWSNDAVKGATDMATGSTLGKRGS